jgi:hypothetical protein
MCLLGLHRWVHVGGGKVATFHDVFNPVYTKKFMCQRCKKMKTMHFEQPHF